MLRASGTEGREGIVPCAAEHDKICPMRQRAQDIKAAANAAVKDDGQACGGADMGQHFDACKRAVKLATCVI